MKLNLTPTFFSLLTIWERFRVCYFNYQQLCTRKESACIRFMAASVYYKYVRQLVVIFIVDMSKYFYFCFSSSSSRLRLLPHTFLPRAFVKSRYDATRDDENGKKLSRSIDHVLVIICTYSLFICTCSYTYTSHYIDVWESARAHSKYVCMHSYTYLYACTPFVFVKNNEISSHADVRVQISVRV